MEIKTEAEKILDPIETVYLKLARLAWASDTQLVASYPEYANRQIQEIAQEMNGALTLVRHHVESLLKNCRPADIEIAQDPHEHYDDGKNHGGL